MSGGAVVIIVDPTKPQQGQTIDGEPDGFAQSLAATSPYSEAIAAIQQAEAAGARVRIIGD